MNKCIYIYTYTHACAIHGIVVRLLIHKGLIWVKAVFGGSSDTGHPGTAAILPASQAVALPWKVPMSGCDTRSLQQEFSCVEI